MSQLMEILRTLREGETVAFSASGLIDGLRIVAFKDNNKPAGIYQVSKIVSNRLMNLSVVEEPEAIELQDMLTTLREDIGVKESPEC
jgi:hypothetical protein